MSTPEPRIFISYARKDGETFATDLRHKLEAEKLTLWQDRDKMEGGVAWWQQITNALEAVEFMVLVATPEAMRSPIVAKEWRYARQQGVCVYPVQVPGLALDFAALPRWMRDSHFYDLDKEWETFVNYLKNPCHAVKVPFMPPDLPGHFVERPDEFNTLKKLLLDADRQNPVAITTALKGAGGFGKTTLAAALCHDDDVQTVFDDGVLWVTLGEQPDLTGALTKLYAALTGENPGFVDAEDGAARLADKLADKDCLIVIDDAWNAAHLRPFLRGGEGCARLVTTRLLDVAVSAKAVTTEVDEMQTAQAAQMLMGGIEPKPTDEAPFRNLAARLGEWPLMLELANGALRKRLTRGASLPDALEYINTVYSEEGVDAFDPRNPAERNQAVGASMAVSLRGLEDAEFHDLCALAIFREDSDVPLTSIAALWGMKPLKAERQIETFADLSLFKFDAERGVIRLHDVIRQYLAAQIGDAPKLHARLIDGWGEPYALPDAYAWREYVYHLQEAERAEKAAALLLDYRWLEAKLAAAGVSELLADYDLLLSPPLYPVERGPGGEVASLRLLQSALRLSAHVLTSAPDQLALQLRGRLLSHCEAHPLIVDLLDSLIQPTNGFQSFGTTTTHQPAGGALLRTLGGHSSRVNGAVALADGRFLSWAWDNTLRLWGSDGAAGAVLSGHTYWVNGAVALADGRFLSWSDDGTLRLWGSDGAAGAVLSGHSSIVNGAVALADGRFLSWSDDGTLRLWDGDGRPLAVLYGDAPITCCVLHPAGDRIVAGDSHGRVLFLRLPPL